ncbi:MAG: hypothetical protein ACFCGT_21140 [Sandaracinaceae bacterium]
MSHASRSTLALVVSMLTGCAPDADPDRDGPTVHAPVGEATAWTTAARAGWIRATQEAAGPRYAWRANASGPALVARSARGSFALDGLGLVLREPGGANGALRLTTVGVGRPGHVRALPRVEPTPEGAANMAVARRGTVVERWVHGPLGVEHVLDVLERPEGSGPLVVRVEAEGLRPVGDGADIAFVDGGVVRARYTDLWVTDASGHALEARMTAAPDAVRLEVEDARAIYPLTIDPLAGAEEALLEASGGANRGRLGAAVAIEENGTRALVGAPNDRSSGSRVEGSALVFAEVGGVWTEEAVLRASGPTSGGSFGWAVSLDRDGARALVGTPLDRPDAGTRTGTARVFLRTGATWAQEAILEPAGAEDFDGVGFAVAISQNGEWAVVGAPFHDPPRGMDAGAAFVFQRAGTTWTEQARLIGSTHSAGDYAGEDVAIDAEGTRIVVGAANDGTAAGVDAGSATVFVRTGAAWAEEAVLEPTAGADGDQFGFRLAIDDGGERIVVGAPSAEVAAPGGPAGAVRIYARTGTIWQEEALFEGGSRDDFFGASIGIDAGASRAVVGAPEADSAASPQAGIARLFVRDGTAWREEAPLFARDGEVRDWFGMAADLSGDGTTALVGVLRDPTGAGADAGTARVFGLADRLARGEACEDDAECASAYCVDGVCCDVACGGGETDDCQACAFEAGAEADGTCSALRMAFAATVVCRAAATPCDAAELCAPGDVACPADVLAPNGTVCRPATGLCDAPEICDGLGLECPPDAVRAAGVECRPALGPCDAAEVCDGVSAACPANELVPAGGATCRPTAGLCDAPERCDGASALCPEDRFMGAGVLCRQERDLCDAAEACTGLSPSCPEDLAQPAGVVCSPARCVAGRSIRTAICDGESVQCTAESGAPCAPYVCGAEACLDRCGRDDECVDGFRCEGGTCVERVGPAADMGPGGGGRSGCGCRVGSAGGPRWPLFGCLLGLATLLALRRRGARPTASRAAPRVAREPPDAARRSAEERGRP